MTQKQRQWATVQNTKQPSLTQLFDDYKGGEDMPLAGYAGLLGVFGAALVGVLRTARRIDGSAHTEAPRTRLGDLLLLGVATHKLARLLSKDRVTSPLRAPFTE
jgi:hypothetical protein